MIKEALELWCHLGYQNIEPKVEFSFVYKIWKALILLNNVTGVPRNILNLLGQKDALSLARIDGFDDKRHRLLLLLHHIHELIGLVWKDPSLREPVKFWTNLLLSKL